MLGIHFKTQRCYGKNLLPSLFHGTFASQETVSANSGNAAGSEGLTVDSLVAVTEEDTTRTTEAIVEDAPQYPKTAPPNAF